MRFITVIHVHSYLGPARLWLPVCIPLPLPRVPVLFTRGSSLFRDAVVCRSTDTLPVAPPLKKTFLLPHQRLAESKSSGSGIPLGPLCSL